MLRHHNGSGRLPVIGPDWAAHHQPVAEGTLRADAALRKPGTTQTWDPEKQQMVATPLTPYAVVKGRVQALRGEARRITLADESQVIADYLIVVPHNVTPTTDDLVEISASGDALLDGRVFVVMQAVVGTERFERDLFCILQH